LEFRVLIRDEAFPQAHGLILRVPQPFIERHNRGIGGTNLDIQLWAPHILELILNMLHEHPAQATPSAFLGNGKVVDPASVSVETCHNGCNDYTVERSDKK
jgi:hypothetical protein